MTDKEYCINLMKEHRKNKEILRGKKPQLRNLNPEKYTEAIKIWTKEMNEIDERMQNVIYSYKNNTVLQL